MNNPKKNITAAVISSYAYIRGHNNYGSILQYYALQTYLKKFNINTYWIRYMFPAKTLYLSLIKRAVKAIINGFKVKNYWNHVRTQLQFRKFMHKYCHVSQQKYDNIQVLKQAPPVADLYITGSDQVWGGCLEPNYLTFAPKNHLKIAYAASFGKREISYEQQLHIQTWIKDFDAISVREESGVEICKKMGMKAEHLLDPTLLIDENDYLAPHIKRLEKKDYAFCYFINEKKLDNLRIDDLIKFTQEKQIKLKITGIEGPEQIISPKYLFQYSPEKWLNHYKYAKYIFTNTFHGTVFCIIFKKQFCVLTQKGATTQQNERLYSLLKLFGLEGRILQPDKEIKKIIDTPINWNNVENIKKECRLKVDFFWENILNNIKS